jgi:hypothetical protein
VGTGTQGTRTKITGDAGYGLPQDGTGWERVSRRVGEIAPARYAFGADATGYPRSW